MKGHGEALNHTLFLNIPCTSSEARGKEVGPNGSPLAY
jgi:hypothetical protein